jgi:hypothetical protein
MSPFEEENHIYTLVFVLKDVQKRYIGMLSQDEQIEFSRLSRNICLIFLLLYFENFL